MRKAVFRLARAMYQYTMQTLRCNLLVHLAVDERWLSHTVKRSFSLNNPSIGSYVPRFPPRFKILGIVDLHSQLRDFIFYNLTSDAHSVCHRPARDPRTLSSPFTIPHTANLVQVLCFRVGLPRPHISYQSCRHFVRCELAKRQWPGLSSLRNANSQTTAASIIDSWGKGLCSQAACSDGALSNIVGNITPGCSAEPAGDGYPTNALTLFPEVQAVYPTIREILCLKECVHDVFCHVATANRSCSVTNGNLCVTNMISDTQNLIGASLGELKKAVGCLSCVRAGYNIAKQSGPVNSNATAYFTAQCGSNLTAASALPFDVRHEGLTHCSC
jgi:hypothetical protein